MSKTKLAHLVPALLFSSALVLAGCGGGSSGGGTPPPPGGGGDTPPPSDGGASNSPTLSFSLSGAVALQAMDQTVVETASLAKASDGRSLFTYRVVNDGLSEAAAESLRTEPRLRAANETAGTNLLAIDEDGNASLALESNYPIKVMYSVADPAGDYVYLALDTGWWGSGDGNDYSQFIAQTNCAFYRVKIADDSYSCVEEGLFVQNMDDNYMQSISGNQKPVQFDSAGNVYFAATSFTPQCDSWSWWDGTQEITETWCYINTTTWNPRIYKASTDGVVNALTQDNTSVDFFLALATGEVVYQGRNTDDWSSYLTMYRNGQTMLLTTENWGVSFFTADTNNTVMFGDWSTEGIRFARPRAAGAGAERTVLSTKLFGQTDGSYYSTPRRIIVGDDGRLYGAFESYRSYYDEDNNYQWENILSVYQILPYDPVPKAELNLGNQGWWSWMERTPFQIAKGYLYYRDRVQVPFNGEADVIRMVRLEDRTVTTLIEPDYDTAAGMYRLNAWRLSGNTLYFSAEHLSGTEAVTGEIDTVAVRQGAPMEDYLSIVPVASALGANAAIQDIEVLRPMAPASDTGMAPQATFHTSPDNLYSVSIDFTKYMDKASVESALSFTADGGATEVESMKVWLYQSLHLIPDLSLSSLALSDAIGKGLNNDTEYTVALQGNVWDIFDWDLSEQTRSATFTTVPTHGWIAADTTATDAAISSGKVAKFIGPKDGKETFVLTKDGVPVDAGGNLRVEFSARNTGWGGVNLVLWNQTRFANRGGYYYDGYEANLRLSGWSNVDYRQEEYSWTTSGSGETSALFNGTWQRYRIDFNGTSLVIAYSTDGVEFTEIDSLEVYDYATSKNVKGAISNFRNRADTEGEEFHLLFRLDAGVLIDDLVVIDLDTEDERLAENFNAADANAIKAVFVEDVDDEYDLEGRW